MTDDDADRPRDRESLAAQLDELEATLTDLRSELRTDERGSPRPPRPPRPPQLGELLRFTEQYTIPTVIAILEATIRSLELLQRTLRLADPARAAREEGDAARDRLDQVGREAGDQLAGALADLRTALSEADLPENPESRDLIEDARELTGEIEGRLRDAERTVSDQRRAETSGGGGVMIDVDDGDGAGETKTVDDTAADASATVDVDAELEAIKHELDEAEAAGDDPDSDATADDDTADDDTANDDTANDDTANDDAGDEDESDADEGTDRHGGDA